MPPATRAVTLPTGDRILVTRTPGGTDALSLPEPLRGGAAVTVRLGSHSYVIPRPAAGHRTPLDLARFDIGAGGSPPAKPANAAWPMHTLTVLGIDHSGGPLEDTVFVMAVDDPAKFAGYAGLIGGVGKLSVPTGRYVMIAVDWTDDGTALIAHSREFAVTAAATRTVDVRTATTPITAATTVPTETQNAALEITRRIESSMGTFATTFGVLGDGAVRVRATPSYPAETGTTIATSSLLAYSPKGQSAGRYALNTARTGPIPDTPLRIVHDARTFTRIDSVFHGPRSSDAALLRTSSQEGGVGWSFGSLITNPGRITEYATSGPGYEVHAEYTLSWSRQLGTIESEWRANPRPTRFTEEWAKTPLHTEIFSDPRVFAPDPVTCFSCVDGTGGLQLWALHHDTYPWHIAYADPGTVTWSVRADATTIASGTDYLMTENSPRIPAGTKTITARVEVRRGAPYRTSTRVNSILQVPLSAVRPLPAGWQCVEPGTCRVLPAVYAAYDLPVTLDGTLPAGRRTLAVRVRQVGAERPAVRSIRLEVDYGGGWRAVPVTATGGGRYAATLAVPAAASGRTAGDLRLTVVTTDGSRLRETIDTAFLLAR